MRDYIYIWNNPEEKFFVASGVLFSDFAEAMGDAGGYLLIEHYSDVAKHDMKSGFDYVSRDETSALVSEDIYSWGNFVWADYSTENLPPLTPNEVAELLYFAHANKPLGKVSVRGLGNRFLTYIHDDGWFLKAYYRDWVDAEAVLVKILPALLISSLEAGDHAVWLKGDSVKIEEKTFDVDKIINRNL